MPKSIHILETGEWKLLAPYGKGPKPRRRQGCVTLDNRVFFFGGTSPLPSDTIPNQEADLNEENNLIDHDDMFILDMGECYTLTLAHFHLHLVRILIQFIFASVFSEPSLKTLCLLKVIQEKLDYSILPRVLKQEIAWMKMPNKILPLSSG